MSSAAAGSTQPVKGRATVLAQAVPNLEHSSSVRTDASLPSISAAVCGCSALHLGLHLVSPTPTAALGGPSSYEAPASPLGKAQPNARARAGRRQSAARGFIILGEDRTGRGPLSLFSSSVPMKGAFRTVTRQRVALRVRPYWRKQGSSCI